MEDHLPLSLGHYEHMVIHFGITNAPATIQHFNNRILHEYLDFICTAFIDKILIYSNTMEEHRHHVRAVLQSLEKAGGFPKPEKGEFHVQHTKYLDPIISSE